MLKTGEREEEEGGGHCIACVHCVLIFVVAQRGLFKHVHFLEGLENLEISQSVEDKGESVVF